MTATFGNPADQGTGTPGVSATGDLNPPMAPLRERLSWALYDFANTIFSMNIATLYFAAWLVGDLGYSNTLYATVNGIASALVVVSIPVFGAISDATQRRKPWVVGFTLIACVSIVVMAILGQSGLPLIGEGITGTASRSMLSASIALFGVLAAFTIANYAYQGAQPFYNAMLPELVPVDHRGRLSGMGAAFGYVGSIVGVLLTIPFFTGTLLILGAIPDHIISFLRKCSSVYRARWPCFHVRPNGDVFPFVLIAAVSILPGSQCRPREETCAVARSVPRRPSNSEGSTEVSRNYEIHSYLVSLSGCSGDDHRYYGTLRNLCDGIR